MKLTLLIFFLFWLVPCLPAQNSIKPSLVVPVKEHISIYMLSNFPGTIQTYTALLGEPVVSSTSFLFNGQELPNPAIKKSIPLIMHMELSFADLFESSMNNLKQGLINTYDDEIPEFFKDAPSLVKLKCVIRL